MTDEIVITIPGQPRGKGRPRFARVGAGVRTYTDDKTRSYEALVRSHAVRAMCGRTLLTGPVAVDLTAFFAVPVSWPKQKQHDALAFRVFPTVKPDMDNIAKGLDALNGIVWTDDAQIVRLSLTKDYGTQPGLILRIRGVRHAGL